MELRKNFSHSPGSRWLFSCRAFFQFPFLWIVIKPCCRFDNGGVRNKLRAIGNLQINIAHLMERPAQQRQSPFGIIRVLPEDKRPSGGPSWVRSLYSLPCPTTLPAPPPMTNMAACPWRIAILTGSAGHGAVPMRRIMLAESSGWQ